MARALRLSLTYLLLAVLAACSPPLVTGPQTGPAPSAVASDLATQRFAAVARQVEPVAEAACVQRKPRRDCGFVILIDERPGLPVNALQTVDRRGRPLLIFTRAILEEFRNPDEIAFVLGHEAAHHIEDHLRQRAEAAGALGSLLEAAAAAQGAPSSGRASAEEIGQVVGARVFSKQFELEADALGAVIAARAGFDPVRGAAFFNRLPDPGDVFLGTHPPNDERLRVVREVAAQLP